MNSPGETSRIGEVGELGVLDELRQILGDEGRGEPEYLGIGDDAALLPRPAADLSLLATVDALVEGVHFERRYAPARLVGRKALSVNLSDIAAMGGVPRYALLALCAPSDLPLAWLRDFAAGLAERAREFGVWVAGGNLASGPCVSATVTVIGEVERGRAVTRSGGKPGDELYVTGPLGSSTLGLALLRGKGPRPPTPVAEALIAAHLDPSPRVHQGRLAARYAHAMIDLSDGLVGDLGHLCRASRCGAELEAAKVPLPRETAALAIALFGHPLQACLWGGEDYELLCAVAPEKAAAFQSAAHACGYEVCAIGRLCGEAGIAVIWEDGRRETVTNRAFEHFR